MSEQPGQPVSDSEAQAAAASQIAAQSELAAPVSGGQPATSPADLGALAAAEGASPDATDPRALLDSIKALQAQVDQLNRERQAANVPDTVKYATAIADHLQARADQHPVLHANPDQTWMPALETAADVVNAANDAAESGDVSKVLEGLDKLRAFFDRHGRKNPTQDYSYLHELADETQAAAQQHAA